MSPTPAVPGAGEELWTEVVVVRHGETVWNASGIVQGQMDTELNEAGRQQAVVVARRLSGEAKLAAVYSSDLKRAAETAEIIARACGVPNVVLNEALRERHMGSLQGLIWDDVVALAKSTDSFKGYDIFNISECSDPDTRNQELPGGGESINQLNERCVSYLNKIAQQHIGERVVVVSQIGGPRPRATRAMALVVRDPVFGFQLCEFGPSHDQILGPPLVSHGAAILGICQHTDPPNGFISRDIPNTSLTVFRVSGVTGQWTLERWGDASHLERNDFLDNSFGGDGASA